MEVVIIFITLEVTSCLRMGLEIIIAQHAAESPGHFFPEQQGA